MPKLRLAILWHMHQPFYLDPVEGRFALPWMRLHSLKDYLDMPLSVGDQPGVAVNFNLVPSLLRQWQAWSLGSQDRVEELCDRPVASLSADERRELQAWLFRAQPDTMIAPLPGYAGLHRRFRAAAAAEFTDAELIRLKFWFHLAWLDPRFRAEPLPASLIDDETLLTEENWPAFKALLDGFPERLFAAYPALHRKGSIEVSLTPFYHPILPLLADSDSAREALPDEELPSRICWPEDVRWQLKASKDFARETLGLEIAGLWPSEGSVSDPAMAMAAEAGFRWAASDEQVLARSLGMQDLHLPATRRAQLLYRPYRRNYEEGALDLIFRDRFLSDRIGFSYASWEPERAVEDFIGHLAAIRDSAVGGDILVPVILDGENCWEHYRQDGGPFLKTLYAALAAESWLCLDTISSHLKEIEPTPLDRLHAGSWIDGSFKIWIGHPEDNQSWETLARVRRDLLAEAGGGAEVPAGGSNLASDQAWHSLYAAEGSDWNWWYGDDHDSEDDAVFDQLFRAHLRGVYRALSRLEPDWLQTPIAEKGRRRGGLTPMGYSRIKLDGSESHFYEWQNAARWRPGGEGGAMTRSNSLLSMIWLAFGEDALHLRLDLTESHPSCKELERLSLEFSHPETRRFRFPFSGKDHRVEAEQREGEAGLWRRLETAARSASGDFLEIRVPWAELPGRPGQEIRFTLTLLSKAGILEIVPAGQPLHFILPDADYDRIMWKV